MTNLILAAVAAALWGGSMFWYFRGSDRLARDFAGIAARLRLRRKDAGE